MSTADGKGRAVVDRPRYAHTNVIARDWQRLARFYQEVFGCEPVGPERDQSGEWLDAVTGVPGAHLRGRHLLLPGHGDGGPTLEIYSYQDSVGRPLPAANGVGFGHIAFEVPDVPGALATFLAHGGSRLGDVRTVEVPGAGRISVVYARDPEGNIVELQAWSA